MPKDKVRKVLKVAKEPISMETPIGDDEDSHLGDFIEDSGVISPIDSATGEGLRETLWLVEQLVASGHISLICAQEAYDRMVSETAHAGYKGTAQATGCDLLRATIDSGQALCSRWKVSTASMSIFLVSTLETSRFGRRRFSPWSNAVEALRSLSMYSRAYSSLLCSR